MTDSFVILIPDVTGWTELLAAIILTSKPETILF